MREAENNGLVPQGTMEEVQRKVSEREKWEGRMRTGRQIMSTESTLDLIEKNKGEGGGGQDRQERKEFKWSPKGKKSPLGDSCQAVSVVLCLSASLSSSVSVSHTCKPPPFPTTARLPTSPCSLAILSRLISLSAYLHPSLTWALNWPEHSKRAWERQQGSSAPH